MFCYIHIPFCESKCKYCRFASVSKTWDILVDKYLKHLLNDIKNFKRPVKNAGLLSSIYFWWWTPSILQENYLWEIINTLKNKFWLEKDIEITLETNPKNITKQNLVSWENLWINRISIWIQTLNDKTLKIIWRDWRKTILNWLRLIKKSKIENIRVDFIIWLPYVKPWEILNDIKYILENYNYIKHISVYMLEDYYKLEKDNLSSFEKIIYPGNWKSLWLKEDEYLKEYLEVKKYLETKWFTRYELSNFAKIWYECKHNKWYWNHSEVVRFWLWSHGFLNNIRYAYKDDFIGYYQWKLEYEEEIKDKDVFLEKVLFWLRTSWIKREIYKKLNQEKIDEFINYWLLEIKNDNLIIADRGITIIDKIILEII